MKIALTVISRVNAHEIEKRFEMEVVEIFQAEPDDAHDPVLEGFETLSMAYRNDFKLSQPMVAVSTPEQVGEILECDVCHKKSEDVRWRYSTLHHGETKKVHTCDACDRQHP